MMLKASHAREIAEQHKSRVAEIEEIIRHHAKNGETYAAITMKMGITQDVCDNLLTALSGAGYTIEGRIIPGSRFTLRW